MQLKPFTPRYRPRTAFGRVTTFLTAIALTGPITFAQDSVRDRLSPGNGPDWAGEPLSDTDEDSTGTQPSTQARLSPPGPDQAWYRRADGRFFYRDQDGNEIFEEQVYEPRNRSANRRWSSTNRRPKLGIALQDSPQGLQVSSVQSGSPAQQAGFRQGDLINRLNDQDATTSQDFVDRVGQLNPGDNVAIDVLRDGKPQRLNATLGTATIQNELYQAARPTLDRSNSTGGTFDVNRFQRDFDQLRRDVDSITRRLNTLSYGSAAKQEVGK